MVRSLNAKEKGVGRTWSGLVLLSLLGLMFAGCGGALPQVVAAEPAAPFQTEPSGSQTAAPIAVGLLKVQPDTGYVNDTFTVTGEELPPHTEVEFVWVTWQGSYDTNVLKETVEFHEPQFVEERVSLGGATTDSQGRISAEFTVPQDFGGPHDIYAVVDGQDLARGGFQINRNVSITPTEGPIGAPITISVTGLGWRALERAMAVRYGNQYTGYVTGVTTRGTATAQIRAAGPPGVHTIELSGLGIHGGGYLNNQQSPYAHLFPSIGSFRFTFTVTEDAGAPPDALQWQEGNPVASLDDNVLRTTASGIPLGAGMSVALEPTSGPILTETTLQASGLAPDAEVELFWVTARGNRVSPSGWDMWDIPLAQESTDGDGSLRATFPVPDDLGGWHVVKLVQQEQVVAEVPFFVEQSLVAVTPRRVKAGEAFTLQLKGIGWTELDNTVAITYNNAYMGYACGFNSNGDITLHMMAVGLPGTHLIDIYPTTYQGKGKRPWGFQMPHLNALEDHPSLALGYNPPVFRLAIEVVE